MNSFTTKPATAKRSYRKTVDWLADWIVGRKRRHPDALFVFGIQGSLGRGKSVFGRRLAQALNERLRPVEGRTIAGSLDDYYLPHEDRQRPSFLARGYRPAGISNRGPAGTHDVRLLKKTLRHLEKTSARSRLELPVFDKQRDDRSPEGSIVRGRVSIFILEGWFVGAAAPAPAARIPKGLAGSVAQALVEYQSIFQRLDALWVFDAPSLSSIVRERRAQQKTLDRESGTPGMTADQIRRFVHYFYKEAWIPGVTSPVPPASRMTFHASMDPGRRWIKIKPGLKFEA